MHRQPEVWKITIILFVICATMFSMDIVDYAADNSPVEESLCSLQPASYKKIRNGTAVGTMNCRFIPDSKTFNKIHAILAFPTDLRIETGDGA